MKTVLGVAAALLCLTLSVHAADVDDLVKQLKDKDPDVRRKAAKDLADAKAEAMPALPMLVAALKDNDLFVRRFSAQAIGAIGEDAKSATPNLKALIKDPKEKKEVQEAAIAALGKMGKGSVEYLGGIVKDSDSDIALRRAAADSLGTLGADAKGAIPALTAALKGEMPKGKKMDQSNDIRLEAADALGNIATPDDKDVLEAMKAINAEKGAKKNKTLFDTINTAVKKIEARRRAMSGPSDEIRRARASAAPGSPPASFPRSLAKRAGPLLRSGPAGSGFVD
jgi:HEAT repeat protein